MKIRNIVSTALILAMILVLINGFQGAYRNGLVYGQPQVSINPAYVNVLQNGFWAGTVVVSGAGFTPSADVLISCGTGVPNSHTIANSQGRIYFVCDENLQPGTYWFFAQDGSTHEASNQVPLSVSALTVQYSTTTTMATVTYPLTITSYLTTITNNVTVSNVVFTTKYANSTFTITLPNYTTITTTTVIPNTVTIFNFNTTTVTSQSTFTVTVGSVVFTTSTVITSTETNTSVTTTTVTTSSTSTETVSNLTTETSVINSTMTIGSPVLPSGTAHVVIFTNPDKGFVFVPMLGTFSSGQTLYLDPTLSYPITAISPYGTHLFSHWVVTGGIIVENPLAQQTIMRVNGDGTLTAYFQS